jgi:hypothetical protein
MEGKARKQIDNEVSEKILCPQGVSVKTPGKNRQFQNVLTTKPQAFTTETHSLATRRVSKRRSGPAIREQGGFFEMNQNHFQGRRLRLFFDDG